MARDTLNVLSLCSGVGGLDLGVELATGGAARVVCHVEREAFAAAILAARMEDETVARAPVWSDLRTFDGRPWRGVVDCVIGGYPCQDFSYAGKRAGFAGSRGSVWFEVARIVAETQPGIVFFENVGGHLSLGFDAVAGELHRMGYRTTAGLFTAAEVGAPHKRERLFILGVADRDDRGQQIGGERNGIPIGWIEPSCRNDTDGCDPDVADTRRERPQGEREVGPAAGAVGRGDGAGVADSTSDGRRECEPQRGADRGTADRGTGDGLGVFPPGPGACAEWERILRVRPDLAPAVEPKICRVFDGTSGRLDQLRALGNGCVPLVAAYAFVSLFACMRED